MYRKWHLGHGVAWGGKRDGAGEHKERVTGESICPDIIVTEVGAVTMIGAVRSFFACQLPAFPASTDGCGRPRGDDEVDHPRPKHIFSLLSRGHLVP